MQRRFFQFQIFLTFQTDCMIVSDSTGNVFWPFTQHLLSGMQMNEDKKLVREKLLWGRKKQVIPPFANNLFEKFWKEMPFAA